VQRNAVSSDWSVAGGCGMERRGMRVAERMAGLLSMSSGCLSIGATHRQNVLVANLLSCETAKCA